MKRYLELAPEGEHAKEVRAMLNYLSALAKAAEGTKKKGMLPDWRPKYSGLSDNRVKTGVEILLAS